MKAVKERFVRDIELEEEMTRPRLKNEFVKQTKSLKTKKTFREIKDKDDGFDYEDVGHGDESFSIKPYLSAIYIPDSYKDIEKNQTPPDEKYVIDFVYGYRSEDVRQNLFYNCKKRPVYMSACLGIIYNPSKKVGNKFTREQIIFGGGEAVDLVSRQNDASLDGHNDDITCLALDNERKLVATGQVGSAPLIFVWDALTAEKISFVRLPRGSRSVTSIGFNYNATLLACVDFSDKFNIHIVDWRKKQILMSNWSPLGDKLCTVAQRSISFWTFTQPNGKPTLKKSNNVSPIEEEGSAVAMLCATHDSKGYCFTGGQNGTIYKWAAEYTGKLVNQQKEIHKGVIHCINYAELGFQGRPSIISGGMDQLVQFLDPETLERLVHVILEGVPRSVDYSKFLLVGMRNGSIVECDILKEVKETIMYSHHDGEVWGLCQVDENVFVTSCDDNKVLMFDISQKKMIQKGAVNLHPEQPAPGMTSVRESIHSRPQGGAPTTSKHPPSQQSRALAYHAKHQHLAVATNIGTVSIREVKFGKSMDLDQECCLIHDTHEWIESMVYSPSGVKLAVGSHDNKIYIYLAPKYTQVHVFSGHTSFINSMDWSNDSRFIRSTSGAYELLYWDIGQKKQIKKKEEMKTVTFNDNQCKLGWAVQGVYPPQTDGTHINTVAQCQSAKLLATGDDYGLVSIYRDPAPTIKHKCRSFRGHSEHVTKVAFAGTHGEYMLSVGGQDQTVIQWRKLTEQELLEAAQQAV
ncbi:hypothetical protein FGO68_gene10203 [Halteria grandinella]|uniref:HELP domain-containing protein n=1 Tax=Halteria grandinella TaxID=5974 RepID=A0A8J8NW81_HALGN|nr:hypothetical protein FGO68_gene10203 [Halteria grandinella]